MNRLTCDIRLGGSTSQFLTYNKRVNSREQFVENVISAIIYRAKTKPYKQARRSVCLIGLIYDQLDGDEYLLDVVIEAINKLSV